MNIFNTVKKAEIHVHLEATITPDLCKKFAKRNNHEISDEFFAFNTHINGMIFMILLKNMTL